MAIAEISISLGGNVLVFLLFGLVLAALALLFYRFTLPPLPQRTRSLLSLLRSFALIFLLMALFEPVSRFVRHTEQPPVVAVLLDNSQSMTINSSPAARKKQVQDLIGQGLLHKLPSGARLQYYPFDAKMKTVAAASPDSVTFTGEVTNISDAFSGLKPLLAKENIQSVLLVSDGNYTVGKNPLYDAEGLGIPVYTVGVGDTSEQQDIVVEKTTTNALAYSGMRTPVDVVIRSSGYDGAKTEVTLSESGTVLDRSVVTLQKGTHEYTLKMHFLPMEEGIKKLLVNVTPISGELTTQNNSRSFFVKVLKSKLNVVIVAGAPSPDLSALRQALVEEGHFSIHSFVQRTAESFYEGSLSQAALDSADCMVLIGFPSQASNPSLIQRLRDNIVRRKLPLFFVGGKGMSYGKLQALEAVLPFGWSGENPTELLVSPIVEDRQKHHALVELENKFTSESWQQLPPIYKAQTIFHGRPESEILVTATLQSINLGEPLVVIRKSLGQKSFAVTGYGIWRWRLLSGDNQQAKEFLTDLASNAIRWLTTPEENKRVKITPNQEAFTTADEVGFSGQVYDEELRPVDNAEVAVQVTHDGESIPVALTAVGNGLYEGSAQGLRAGDYTFSGGATRNGISLGEDKGKFSVGQVSVEYIETKMNKQLLEQLAYRTGGSYRDISSAEAITADLPTGTAFRSRDLTQASEIELWNWKYLAVIVIALFSAEWFVRKRNGML